MARIGDLEFPVRAHRSARVAVVLAATTAGLVACGGSGGGNTISTQPSGYAYVTSADSEGRQVSGAVYQFAINTDGSLTPLAEPSVPTGVTPLAVILDQTAHYVYVANLGDRAISQYAAGRDGVLTPMSVASVAIPAPFTNVGGYWLSQNPSTGTLYVVANAAGAAASSVAEFSIGTNGMLTALAPAYVEVPAAASGPLAFGRAGHYAYLAGTVGTQSGQVAQFSVGPDGSLSALTPASVPVAATPTAVAISPSQTAYVLSRCVDQACDGEIALFSIGADGALSATGASILTGGHVIPLALVTEGPGPSPYTAYLLANFMGVDTNAGSVYQYAIDATGGLIPDTPSSVAVTSGAVAEGAFGPDVYALSSNQVGSANGSPGGQVDHYYIGSDGVLTAAGRTPVPGLPTALAVPAAFVAP